jgi:hypothetical protein
MNKLIKEFNEGTRRKTDPRYKKLSRVSGGVVKAHTLGIQERLGRDLSTKGRYKRL